MRKIQKSEIYFLMLFARDLVVISTHPLFVNVKDLEKVSTAARYSTYSSMQYSSHNNSVLKAPRPLFLIHFLPLN